MDPVAALEEIAFLLERDRASSYKSKAFRRAAAIIEEYSPEELAARVRDGRLKRTKGIGDSTYAVIANGIPSSAPGASSAFCSSGSVPSLPACAGSSEGA